MPRDSGYAHPSTSGESLNRGISVGPAAAQSQAPPFGSSGPVQSQGLPHRVSLSFDASGGTSPVHVDGEEEEDDHDFVVSASPVMDKTLSRLISFVYKDYPESRPLSSPHLPPRCGLESLFAVVDLPRFFLSEASIAPLSV